MQKWLGAYLENMISGGLLVVAGVVPLLFLDLTSDSEVSTNLSTPKVAAPRVSESAAGVVEGVWALTGITAEAAKRTRNKATEHIIKS